MKLTDAIKEGQNFWLGPFVRVHEIGEYQFLEYEEKTFDSRSKPGTLTGRRMFSIYINGDHTSHSAASLDEAMAQAISYKHAGPNSQAGSLVMKMIR